MSICRSNWLLLCFLSHFVYLLSLSRLFLRIHFCSSDADRDWGSLSKAGYDNMQPRYPMDQHVPVQLVSAYRLGGCRWALQREAFVMSRSLSICSPRDRLKNSVWAGFVWWEVSWFMIENNLLNQGCGYLGVLGVGRNSCRMSAVRQWYQPDPGMIGSGTNVWQVGNWWRFGDGLVTVWWRFGDGLVTVETWYPCPFSETDGENMFLWRCDGFFPVYPSRVRVRAYARILSTIKTVTPSRYP